MKVDAFPMVKFANFHVIPCSVIGAVSRAALWGGFCFEPPNRDQLFHLLLPGSKGWLLTSNIPNHNPAPSFPWHFPRAE